MAVLRARRLLLLLLPLLLLAFQTGCGEQAATTGSAAPGTPNVPGLPTVENAVDLTKEPKAAAVPEGQGELLTSSVQTHDLVEGTGRVAGAEDTVQVRYVGTGYRDGEKFDSSWDAGMEPAEFSLRQTVAGFRLGIAGMKEGGRRIIAMPAAQAYGATPDPENPLAGKDLVFVVDLVKVL